jgi:hypothetical protein
MVCGHITNRLARASLHAQNKRIHTAFAAEDHSIAVLNENSSVRLFIFMISHIHNQSYLSSDSQYNCVQYNINSQTYRQ